MQAKPPNQEVLKELHDRNHHIQILKSFLKNETVEKALDYLNEFQSSSENNTNDLDIISDKSSPFILSGNDIIDYILAEGEKKRKEKILLWKSMYLFFPLFFRFVLVIYVAFSPMPLTMPLNLHINSFKL